MEINKELIDQIQRGDRKAILSLYEHSFTCLMGTAVRYKTNREDQMTIVNNAFMKIVNHIVSFTPGTAYFSWIKKIVQREVIDEFRRNKKYLELMSSDANVETGRVDDLVHSEFENEVDAEELLRLLDHLPPATKLVFNLYAIDEYTSAEIMKELDISYETVKWHIKEARKKLRNLLQNELKGKYCERA